VDPDPNFHPDVDLDPDPKFRRKAQNLEKCLNRLIFHTFWLVLQIDADPYPDLAYHFDADPHPDF
jgi:hypothetical protein